MNPNLEIERLSRLISSDEGLLDRVRKRRGTDAVRPVMDEVRAQWTLIAQYFETSDSIPKRLASVAISFCHDALALISNPQWRCDEKVEGWLKKQIAEIQAFFSLTEIPDLSPTEEFRIASGVETVLIAIRHSFHDELRSLVPSEVDAAHSWWCSGSDAVRNLIGFACEFGSRESVRYLLEQGARPCPPKPGRVSPLMLAAQRDDLDMVRLLIEHGADPLYRTSTGQSALSWSRKSPSVIDFMLRFDELSGPEAKILPLRSRS